jgi:hypothetical protein
MDLLFFVLVAYGMTQIIVYGSIFNKVRPAKERFWGLAELFHCPMCMGFWVGVFLWVISSWTSLFTFENILLLRNTASGVTVTFQLENLWDGFLLGCLSSGTSYVLNMIFGDGGININENH